LQTIAVRKEKMMTLNKEDKRQVLENRQQLIDLRAKVKKGELSPSPSESIDLNIKTAPAKRYISGLQLTVS